VKKDVPISITRRKESKVGNSPLHRANTTASSGSRSVLSAAQEASSSRHRGGKQFRRVHKQTADRQRIGGVEAVNRTANT
jgi:hypothetical protein